MPLHQQDPWVMQFFVQDEFNLKPALKHLKKPIDSSLLNDPFTQDYLERLENLYQKMSRPEGLFCDPRTGKPFRGRRRRLRLLCYRRYQQTKVSRDFALNEHESVIQQVMEKLLSPGLSLKRLTGKAYYPWWVNWFNPRPIQTEGKTEKLLEQFPYPKKKPAGFSFPQNILFSPPHSNASGFLFDGLIHRCLYVDGLKETPEIGLLSRERKQANPKHFYAMLDQLPEGAIFTTQIIFSSDESLDKHLQRLEQGVIGTSLKPQSVKADIKRARDELSLGNRLFWVNQAVLFRAEDEQKAEVIEQQLLNLFFDNKMPLIPSAMDLHPLNSYLNALPFNFILANTFAMND